jgi:L-rhamnose mutarotase
MGQYSYSKGKTQQDQENFMRKAVYFRLKSGAADEYKRRHATVPAEIEAVLTEAGYKNYSIWRIDNFLFAYFEVEDEEWASRVFAGSRAYARWRTWMEDVVEVNPDGQKEWPMELVFLHKA